MDELIATTAGRAIRELIVYGAFFSIPVALYLAYLHGRWFVQGRERRFHAAFVLFFVCYSLTTALLGEAILHLTEVEPTVRSVLYSVGLGGMFFGLLGIASGYRREHRYRAKEG